VISAGARVQNTRGGAFSCLLMYFVQNTRMDHLPLLIVELKQKAISGSSRDEIQRGLEEVKTAVFQSLAHLAVLAFPVRGACSRDTLDARMSAAMRVFAALGEVPPSALQQDECLLRSWQCVRVQVHHFIGCVRAVLECIQSSDTEEGQ